MLRHVNTIIVDRSDLFRAGLMRVLTSSRFRVKAAKPSLAALSDTVLQSEAETILLMGLDGLSAAQFSAMSSLKSAHPNLKIVALSSKFDLKELSRAVEAGADGYLLKGEIATEELLKALDLTLLGEAVLPQRFMQLMRSGILLTPSGQPDDCDIISSNIIPSNENQPNEIEPEGPDASRFDRLSAKEEIILNYLRKGASNKHIARDLNVAEATVKVHVKAILRKARVQNRTQAAIWAMNNLKLSEPIRKEVGSMESDAILCPS